MSMTSSKTGTLSPMPLTNTDDDLYWSRLIELLDQVTFLENFYWQSQRKSKVSGDEMTKTIETNQTLYQPKVIEPEEENKSPKFRLAETNTAQKVDSLKNGSSDNRVDMHPNPNTLEAMENIFQQVENHLQNMTPFNDCEIKLDIEQRERELVDVVTEFDKIKREMERLLAKYDREHKRKINQEKLLRTKLFEFREMVRQVKLRNDEELKKVHAELALTKSSLQKELDYRKEIEDRNHKLLQEQRDLLSRLADQDEIIRLSASTKTLNC